jgi:drug/metabolite transporter (DMT)-like permease
VRPSSTPIIVVLGLSVLTVAADYCLKRASDQASPFASPWFGVGLAVYSATAFGWVYVMRHLTFATIGVVYSVAIILLLAAVGVTVLREPLRWQEVVGIGLAIAAIVLLVRFA